MAQTIALYKGSTTISSGAATTLFTNSASGTASRVRFGYLSWTSDFATVRGFLSIQVFPSGATYPSLLAAGYSASDARHVSAIPLSSYTGMSSGTSTITLYAPSFWSSAATFLTSVNSITQSQQNPGSSVFYNQDCLIGPSDVIKANWQDSGGGSRSAEINYCISTITES